MLRRVNAASRMANCPDYAEPPHPNPLPTGERETVKSALASGAGAALAAYFENMPGKDMTKEPDTKAADLEKARVIVGEFGLLIGPAGTASETVALAVADGIALGRKEGLAMAAKAAGGKDTRGR